MKNLAILIFAFLATACATVGNDSLPDEADLDPRAQPSAMAVVANIAALQMLRDGDTESATLLLESYLNVNLITLWQIPAEQNMPRLNNIMKRAAEYREKYPEPNSKVDPYLKKYISEKAGSGK